MVTGFTEGEPDIQLKAVVHIIEEYDRPEAWFAHLKMDFRIIDFKTGEQVLFHFFDRERKMASKKIEHLPISISSLLQDELDKLINKLKK